MNSLERKIKSEQNSIRNHLLSIFKDSNHIYQLQRVLNHSLPLIANIRNGKWYSNNFLSTCYFKSTDGHEGSEVYNVNRMNLELIDTIVSYGGVVIVDSTTRGKHFPDSMRATIPIWCAVINCILFGEGKNYDQHFISPNWISITQRNKICDNIQRYINSNKFQPYYYHIYNTLYSKFAKPARPFWVTVTPDGTIDFLDDEIEAVLDSLQHTNITENTDITNTIPCATLPYHPIILFSCSPKVTDTDHIHMRQHQSWTYIQGAGDDEENWARGLNPEIFWAYSTELLGILDSVELERRIDELVKDAANKSSTRYRYTSNTLLTDTSTSVNNIHTAVDVSQIHASTIASSDASSDTHDKYTHELTTLHTTLKHVPHTSLCLTHTSTALIAHLIHSHTTSEERNRLIDRYLLGHHTLTGTGTAGACESSNDAVGGCVRVEGGDDNKMEGCICILICHPTHATPSSGSIVHTTVSNTRACNTINSSSSDAYNRHRDGKNTNSILPLHMSSDKKYRQHLHSYYSTAVQSCYTHILSQPNKKVIILSDDLGISHMLLTSLVLRFYRHIIPYSTNASLPPDLHDNNTSSATNSKTGSNSTNNDSVYLDYNSSNSGNSISKDEVKFVVNWVQSIDPRLIVSRGNMKELYLTHTSSVLI